MAEHRRGIETPPVEPSTISIRALWSRRDVAALLSCSTKSVDAEIASGALAAVRHGSRVKITAAELNRYVAALPPVPVSGGPVVMGTIPDDDLDAMIQATIPKSVA